MAIDFKPSWLSVALATAMLAPVAASARVLTVGGDFACDHHDLQAALDTAATLPGRVTIRIARNLYHVNAEYIVRSNDVALQGGYADCRRDRPLGVTRVGSASHPAKIVHVDAATFRIERIVGLATELNSVERAMTAEVTER